MIQAFDWRTRHERLGTEWDIIWDLSELIIAAQHTEDKIREKIIKHSSNPEDLSKLTLKELLQLEINYTVDDNKSTDEIIKEVSELLIKGGWTTQDAIAALINNDSFKNIKFEIDKGNPYTNKNELAKALLNLSYVKKLGYAEIDIQMAGLDRVDRDMTINLYAWDKRTKKELKINKNSYVTLMDEVKSNTDNLYLGSSVQGAQWLYDIIKKDSRKRLKVSANNSKVQVFLYKDELVRLVNGMIQHKYQAVGRGTSDSHFTSNVFISTPNNTQVVLLSEVLSKLQDDLNNHNVKAEDYILSLVFQYNSKNKLQGSVYYGKMK